MEKSEVYMMDFHATPKQNLLQKLEKLLKTAGMQKINFSKKMVAVKIHFGEPGNLAYIRPNYAAVVVKMIKEWQGLPFLTDTNTLYKGRRSDAVNHLQTAMENGFNPMVVGCNVIIADGLKGTDYREIEINQKNCKTAKIGTALADADIIITVNHFKGHEITGFGGVLKNIGMGGGSVGGKLEMHSDSSPVIDKDKCTGCNMCVDNCNYDAIKLNDDQIAVIDYSKCTGCGQCIAMCQYDAPQPQWNSKSTQEKIMEYALAALKGKSAFHINFITDVSPFCDCWGFNDIPFVQNIGILASTDPVALDKACADLVNKVPVVQESCIGKDYQAGEDKFTKIFHNTDWKIGIDYAEKLGLGTQQYELKIVE